MKPIVFSLFDSADFSKNYNTVEHGDLELSIFPDGETYLKINSDVKNRKIIIISSLNNANEKFLPLLLTAKTLKEFGASEIILIAPYLGYMRQDKSFHPGESVTSKYVAKLLSENFDGLITVDPHLHRYKKMSEIYSIPTEVLHATEAMADWIKKNVANPVIIGPDAESIQWASDIAARVSCPFVILEKTRMDSSHVKVMLPDMSDYKNHTPVLIDDIISTARTMIEAVLELQKIHMQPAVCIGVHAVFAGNAYEELLKTGAQVLTCNTITHVSNAIDLSTMILQAAIKSIT